MSKTFILIALSFLILARLACANSSVSTFSQYINSSEQSVNAQAAPIKKDEDTSWAQTDDKNSKDSDDNDSHAEHGPVFKGIPAKWKACSVDSDCTAAAPDCETWLGINKKYLSKLDKYLSTCSADIDPGFQPAAACVTGTCQTTDKTTGISWEEWLGLVTKPRQGH